MSGKKKQSLAHRISFYPSPYQLKILIATCYLHDKNQTKAVSLLVQKAIELTPKNELDRLLQIANDDTIEEIVKLKAKKT